MQALLSYDQAPPFAAPLRFFLTAPLFGVLAGLLLLIEGPAILSSRWQPGALAMTHLLTVGFMLQVMLGALIQILPVVAGANLNRLAMLAPLSHISLSLGTLFLVWGFLSVSSAALQVGAGLLGGAGLLFLLASSRALSGVPSTSPTIRGLKLALGGLFAVMLLGIFLVLALQQGTTFSLIALTDLHAAWGLAAWSGILLVAVAYVVVPMFQLTPGYPARPSWWFPLAIFALLLLWSVALWIDLPLLIRLAKAFLALSGLVFCGLTLRLQKQSRRARSDTTSRYWKLGLVSSISALLMLLTAAVWPELGEIDAWPLCFAVLLIVGGFLSFILGMLYKIVPFLAWLHLQNLGKGQVMAPTMNKLLSDSSAQRQFFAYGVAVALLLLAVFFPEYFARPAGIGLMLASGGLGFNLFGVVRRYRVSAREIGLKLATC